MKRNISYYLALVLYIIIQSSCVKEYLDKKPDQSLLVPTTLADIRALLDNSATMNDVPTLAMLAADDYYTTDAGLKAYTTAPERNSYLWLDDLYEGFSTINDWNGPYKQIFYANVVLEGLEKLENEKGSETEWKNLKGTALFFRAWAYYQLAQTFCAPYQASNAENLPGLPLRLIADVNNRTGRGKLSETYNRILQDLETTLNLLPENVATNNRPNLPAALALLARTYLTMGTYEKALFYANESLTKYNKLIDYNTLTTTAARPLPRPIPYGNDEVLFYAISGSYSFLIGPRATLTSIDSLLYKSYDNNDLRKKAFFTDRGNKIVTFKGNYTGTTTIFAGLATDELYLIKAECLARAGQTSTAMETLNILLKNRFLKTAFVPLTASDKERALQLILKERRKELVTRGTRWADLRRLNMESGTATTISRTFEGKTYTLEPNSIKFVYTIPDAEIRNTGIAQNPR